MALNTYNPFFDSHTWAEKSIGVENVSRKHHLNNKLPCRAKWRKRLRLPACSNSLLPKQGVYLPERPWAFAIRLSPEFICDDSVTCNLDMKQA